MRIPELPPLPSFDVYARRRIASITLVLAAAAVIAFAINGASTSTGSPDPRELVPADALAYTEVHLDPAREQSAAASAFASGLPKISKQVVARLSAPGTFGDVGLGPTRDGWFGGEFASASLPEGAGVELFASNDDAAALRFAGKYVGSPAKTSYRATEILAGKHASAAIVGSFLVIGEDVAVRRAVDTNEGAPSLASYRPARAVLSALPSPSFARFYVAAVADQPLGPLSPLHGPAALAVRFAGDSLELAAHVRAGSQARPALAQLATFKPTLEQTLAAGTLGYFGAGPATAAERALLSRLGGSLPGVVSQVASQLGVSDLKLLARQLVRVLGKETALTVVPGRATSQGQFPTPPAIGLISKGVAARESLHALHALRKDVTGEVRGNRLLLAGDPSALRRLADPKGSLTSTRVFRSATAGLASKPAAEAYLDLGGLVPLFEAAGLAENPAYSSFAPEFHRLGAVGATLRPSRRSLDVSLRLTLGHK